MSRQRAAAAAAVRMLNVEGITAPIEIRRHPRARRLTLRVCRSEGNVVLTMPRYSDMREANRFLSSNVAWLRERLQGVPEPVPFEPGAIMPLRGVPHELHFLGTSCRSGVVQVHEDGGEQVTARLVVSGRTEHAPRRLKDWLLAEALRDIDTSVTYHAANLGLRARRITLRDQKSRWGSCSSSGQLSFSWRLILAPPVVLDYVAAHEVAHLAEMNHGPRFWKLVAETMPRLEEARRWLHAHGVELHRYGVERA